MADETEIKFRFTPKGQQISAAILGGKDKIEFTKAAASIDVHINDTDVDVANIVDLDNKKQIVDISDTVAVADNVVQIPIKFEKNKITEDYQMNTIGIYVNYQGQEVLYAFGALKYPLYMHHTNDSGVFKMYTYITVGTVANVVIKTNDAENVSRDELNDALAKKVGSVDGIKPDNTGNVVTGAAKSVNGYTPDSSGEIDITDLLNKNFGINAGNAAYRDTLANNVMSATQNGNSDSIGNNINWINNWRTTINNAMQSISVLGTANAVIYIRRLLAYMKLITKVAENGNSYYTAGGVSGFSLQKTIYGSFNEAISVFNSMESSTFAGGHWFYILSLPSPAIFANNPSVVTGLNGSCTIMSAIAFRVSGYSSVYYAPTADILDLIYFSSMV